MMNIDHLHHLPTYNPNLNPIERLWQIMNKQVKNNYHFASAKVLRQEIHRFFQDMLPGLAGVLLRRVNDNFQTMKNATLSELIITHNAWPIWNDDWRCWHRGELNMGSPKCAWRRIAVCAMASMCLTGCANNEMSAPISSLVGGNDGGGYRGNTPTTVKSAQQLEKSRSAATVSGGVQNQVNGSIKEFFFTIEAMTTFRKVPIPARRIR